MGGAADLDGTFDDRSPIYQQINHRIKRRIACGSAAPWERLPSIRDLAAQLRVNANTVARSYQELEREGLIQSQRGLGYTIAKGAGQTVRDELIKSALDAYFEEMQALGIAREEAAALAQSHVGGRESDAD